MTPVLRLPDPARIARAAEVIDPAFLNSPFIGNAALDARLGCTIRSKVETLNPLRSFKGRGTDLAVASVPLPADAPRIVCASAGNFGQGIAYAGAKRGIETVVYVATNANALKIEAMRRLGARVILKGDDFDGAKRAGRDYAAATGSLFIEDGAIPEVAEGAGTIALEMTRSGARFDVALVPLGNGALLTGIGTWLKHERPDCRVIGVVADRAPAMLLSWQAHQMIETPAADTIADGVAVRIPVPYALTCMEKTVDEVLSVSEASILAAMRLAHETLGLVVEPAGILGLAAILQHNTAFRQAEVATILCGGNLTPEQIRLFLTSEAGSPHRAGVLETL